MNTSTRWTMAIAAVVVALIAGLGVELRHAPPSPGNGTVSTERQQGGGDTGTSLAGPRKRADLPPCPAGPAGGGPAVLHGISVECAADGALVDAARVLAGRRVLLNLWAYWCAPCRAELPAMAEYQRRAGPDVLVVTVHQDGNEAAALTLLADLGVRLPTLQDGTRRVAAALRAPNVMPATVMLAADGSVSRILPRAFTDVEEISAAVGDRK